MDIKKILLLCTAVCCVFLFGSCKSKSSAYKTAYEQAKYDEEKWTSTEVKDEGDDEASPSENVSYESVKQEKVKPAYGEDEDNLKRFSVVIGSFKNRTNAYSLKERMQDEGYEPVVAENDYGMLRVIVTSFNSKADAQRSRDAIKSKYAPNFQDAWLLERAY